MKYRFYKYQGTGNDFVMFQDLEGRFPLSDRELVARLCDRRFGIGADGLILLRRAADHDFEMVYFNADGNVGTMCGNGGRCAVRFANDLGLIAERTTFLASDGPHEAYLAKGLVHLKMSDVTEVAEGQGYYFADTGSPHYITFVDQLAAYPVYERGKAIRHSPPFARQGGTNVNFVEEKADFLDLRTFERGVEDETFACGTGATAVALVAALRGRKSPVPIRVKGGQLQVAFSQVNGKFQNIYLIGPATFVFEGTIEI